MAARKRRAGRSRIWWPALCAVLLGAMSGLSAPLARADDATVPSNAALAARLLDAADTRMKAKLEEARLLDASGRRDDALRALAEVDKIYERALELVRPLMAPSAPVVRVVPSAPRPYRDPFSNSGAAPPRLPAEPAPVVLQPKADPVPGAVTYLLRCQTDDGLFHASVGRAPGDTETDPARDGRATAMAILAILDAAPATLPTELSTNLRRAMVRAGTALVARADEHGALDKDLESHAYALWALAAAYGDLAVAEWKPALQAALAYALSARDTRGLWSVPAGDADSLRTSATMIAALHECVPLTASVGRTDEIVAAIAQARGAPSIPVAPGDEAARSERELIRLSPRSLTLLEIGRGDDAPGTGKPVRPAGFEATPLRPALLLWGTVLGRAQWGGLESPSFVAWWNQMLVPSMDLQEREPSPVAGSWSGGVGAAAASRLEVTALCLLAWKVPTAEYADPVAR